MDFGGEAIGALAEVFLSEAGVAGVVFDEKGADDSGLWGGIRHWFPGVGRW